LRPGRRKIGQLTEHSLPYDRGLIASTSPSTVGASDFPDPFQPGHEPGPARGRQVQVNPIGSTLAG